MAKKRRQQRSKWPVARLGEVGNGALEIMDEYRAELEPRLAAGLIDGLRADVAAFDGKVSAAKRAPAELRALTLDQNAAARAGHAFVVAVREAITRAGGTAGERKTFGAGLRIHARSVGDVHAGLDAILDGAAKFPELARRAGLLEADLTAARALGASLAGADAVQKRKKEGRKTPVARRTGIARRIEAAVDAIISVALVRFFARPEVAARFRALVPSRRRGAPGGGTPPA